MDQKKTTINIRVTEREKGTIEAMAAKRGINRSAYILERSLAPLEDSNSIIYTKDFHKAVYALCILNDKLDNLAVGTDENLKSAIREYRKGVRAIWQYLR